jgi:hypothetical protein
MPSGEGRAQWLRTVPWSEPAQRFHRLGGRWRRRRDHRQARRTRPCFLSAWRPIIQYSMRLPKTALLRNDWDFENSSSNEYPQPREENIFLMPRRWAVISRGKYKGFVEESKKHPHYAANEGNPSSPTLYASYVPFQRRISSECFSASTRARASCGNSLKCFIYSSELDRHTKAPFPEAVKTSAFLARGYQRLDSDNHEVYSLRP